MSTDVLPTGDARPSLAQIFRVFLVMGATSLGGGVVGYLRTGLVVRHRWVDDVTFVELLSISQTLPGLNATNMSILVGDRLRGEFAHDEPAIARVIEKAFRRKRMQRRTDRRARHAESTGQMHLVDALTRRELTCEDRFPNAVGRGHGTRRRALVTIENIHHRFGRIYLGPARSLGAHAASLSSQLNTLS